MAKMKGSAIVRALLIENEDGWVAQCLDYDIAAQAQSLPDLLAELKRVLISHVAISLDLGREPFAGFPRAPQRYWDVYERTHWRMEPDDGWSATDELAPAGVLPQLKVTHARELGIA